MKIIKIVSKPLLPLIYIINELFLQISTVLGHRCELDNCFFRWAISQGVWNVIIKMKIIRSVIMLKYQ